MALLKPYQRKERVPLDELFALDIEASGSPFDEESYAVSLGVAGPDGTWYWLVKPAQGWDHWDEAAEEMHGISRKELERNGLDVALLCHELNRQFEGQILVVDSLADLDWSSKLFGASGVHMHFDICYLSSVLNHDHAARIIASINDVEWPHRADQDAIMLRNTILQQQRAEREGCEYR